VSIDGTGKKHAAANHSARKPIWKVMDLVGLIIPEVWNYIVLHANNPGCTRFTGKWKSLPRMFGVQYLPVIGANTVWGVAVLCE
jgi:hypothetical protein